MNEPLATAFSHSSLRSVRLLLILTFTASTLFLMLVETDLDPLWGKQHGELLGGLFACVVQLSVASIGGYLGCLVGGRNSIADGAVAAIGIMWSLWAAWVVVVLLIGAIRSWAW